MYVPFEKLPDHSRLWIYQANRPLTDVELSFVEGKLREFTDSWAAHSKPLQASFKTELNQFIFLAVDEDVNDASGCSIDSSVELLKKIEDELHVILLDRSSVAYEQEGVVQQANFKNIKEEIKIGNIQPRTIVFNNAISKIAELKSDWQKPAKDTWLSRYFK